MLGQFGGPRLEPMRLQGSGVDQTQEAQKDALTVLAAAALESFLASGSSLVFARPSRPVVSVLLVLHGRAELTLRCLLSLRGETTPIEVVLVDNASTDVTPRLLERLAGVSVTRNDENLGFARAANQAARLARGDYLLFLNNDCELLPRSLDAARALIERDPGVGAVGGRLLLLDGRLQEAGSIVWDDGSCLGYGRGDSPLAPPYMFERDVDYCSAALLLTRRDLFLACGGFDEAFRPAYYEDVDYCLRLWESGRRVVYEPNVAALHFEFASSTSRAEALALQRRQRAAFVAKHAPTLERQPAAGARDALSARARHAGLRVLFVDDRVPHPWLGSGFPRSREILASLVRSGHFVTFYPLTSPNESWPGARASIPARVEVMLGHGVERFDEFRREREGYYDAVIVSRDHNLRRLRELARGGPIFGATPVIYDAEALSCLRDVTRRRLAGERVESAEVERLVREEAEPARGLGAVTCASAADAARLREAGVAALVPLGHAIEPAPGPRPHSEREGLLFVGAVPEAASPNADALDWLVHEILPRARALAGRPLPLTIAGLRRSAPAAPTVEEGVERLGPVDDLEPLYARARVFVAPVRFGAGLPRKLHDAAGHGLPIVCTSLLAGQVGWTDGVELLVADDAETFARRCAELHEDAELWRRLRDRALARVARDCDPRAFDAALRSALDLALGPARGAGQRGTAPARALGALPPAPAPASAATPLSRLLADDRADRLAQLERALEGARREAAALRASASWRVTAPLRALHAWLLGRR